jgi:hypothetical protein
METKMNQDVKPVQVEVMEEKTASLVKAEIDQQVSTAKRYPRDLSRFMSNAKTMVSINEDVAGACFYRLPRSNKTIEGPSTRLAEIVASSWGNIRAGARIISDDGKYVTSQGVCHDLENNVCTTIEVKRRVVGKNGQRFSDDMVTVTSNAANAIAYRNAVFKIIPKCYTDEIFKHAKQVSIGNIATLPQRRAKLMDYFAKIGVSEYHVLKTLKKKSIEEIGEEDFLTLRGIATAIKDGEVSPDSAFNLHESILEKQKTTKASDVFGDSNNENNKNKKAEKVKPQAKKTETKKENSTDDLVLQEEQ